MKAFEYDNLNQTASNRLRTTWVSLPDQFGRVSTGLLFEAPWVDGSSRVTLGCSVDARWADATLSSTGSTGNRDNPGSLGSVCQASVANLAPGHDISDWPRYSEFRPTNDSSWSSIQLEQSWLDILTPYVEVNDILREQSWHAKTLESLLYDALATKDLMHPEFSQTAVWNMMDVGALNRTITLEWVLATVVADGLSREGSARVLNTTGEPILWTILDYNKTADFSKQLLNGGNPLEAPIGVGLIKNHASILISGYSYKASVFIDYLSIGILIICMLLAFYHIVELVIRRRVSDCWDTITEVLALMQNSRPAILALKNTCAGIKELGTYAQLAIIRVLQPDSATSVTDMPHIELIFKDVNEEEQRPVELRTLSHDSTSLRARLVSTSVRSRTWAPGSENYSDSTSTHGREGRYSEQAEPNKQNARKTNIEMTKLQMNTLYG